MTIARSLRLATLFTLALFLYYGTPIAVTHVVAQDRSFTIDQVFSAPFPTDLVAAPSHERIAWVFDARGSRNVWVAEPCATGSYRSKAVTSYTGDDGESVGELAWSPDGESVAYVRGGDLGEGGPDINALSLPQGAPPKETWVVSVGHGDPRKLADGDSPAISPKGDSVVYLSHGQIWLVSFDGSGKPEALVSLKGKIDSLRWSPDGSRIAFVSGRGTHAIVGIYDFAKKSIIWLAVARQNSVRTKMRSSLAQRLAAN